MMFERFFASIRGFYSSPNEDPEAEADALPRNGANGPPHLPTPTDRGTRSDPIPSKDFLSALREHGLDSSCIVPPEESAKDELEGSASVDVIHWSPNTDSSVPPFSDSMPSNDHRANLPAAPLEPLQELCHSPTTSDSFSFSTKHCSEAEHHMEIQLGERDSAFATNGFERPDEDGAAKGAVVSPASSPSSVLECPAPETCPAESAQVTSEDDSSSSRPSVVSSTAPVEMDSEVLDAYEGSDERSAATSPSSPTGSLQDRTDRSGTPRASACRAGTGTGTDGASPPEAIVVPPSPLLPRKRPPATQPPLLTLPCTSLDFDCWRRERIEAWAAAPGKRRKLPLEKRLKGFDRHMDQARDHFDDDDDLDPHANFGNTTYGKVLTPGGEALAKHLELPEEGDWDGKKNQVFVDFGHGVGNTVFQMAETRGHCLIESRGIEIVQDRFDRSLEYWQFLDGIPGVELVLGDLADPIHRDFLTRAGIIKAFANNYDGFWSQKSHRSMRDMSKPSLDDYLAGLFAHMPPGSILVTLSPLRLGMSQSRAAEMEARHGWAPDRRRSFFRDERIELGQRGETFSWNEAQNDAGPVAAYKYTRLDQSTPGEAVFLCCTPYCSNCIDAVPIPATRLEAGTNKLLINHCDRCNVGTRTLRSRRKGKS